MRDFFSAGYYDFQKAFDLDYVQLVIAERSSLLVTTTYLIHLGVLSLITIQITIFPGLTVLVSFSLPKGILYIFAFYTYK